MLERKPRQPFHTYRRAAGLTIDGAAQAFGVDRTTIIRWEKGEPHIPLKRCDDALTIIKAGKRELRPDVFEGA